MNDSYVWNIVSCAVRNVYIFSMYFKITLAWEFFPMTLVHYSTFNAHFNLTTCSKFNCKARKCLLFSSTPLDPVCPNLFLRPSPLICAQRFFNLWFALRPFSTANSDRSCPKRIFPGRYALTKRWTCCELLRWAVRHVVEIHFTNFRISTI